MKKHIHLFAYCLLSSVCFNADAIAPDDNILSQDVDRAITELSALTQDEQAAEMRSLCGSRNCSKRNCNQSNCCGCTPKNDCCTKLQCRRIISTLDVVESKVCLLTECEPIPLSQSDVDITSGVLTIDNPGLYCLATDINGSISIQASEVTLDLNCHAITAGSSATVDPIQGQSGVDSVSVINGIVDANNVGSLNAVSFTDSTNIHLSGLTVRNAVDGISARVTNLFLEHIFSEMNRGTGCHLTGCTSVLISDSIFCNSVRGLLLNESASTDVIVTNCQFLNNTSRGADIQENSTIYFFSCIAANNNGGGFLSFANIYAFDCVADSNNPDGPGFNGANLNPGQAGIMFLERCVASNHDNAGFDAGQFASGTISQCVALNNGTGFADGGGGQEYTSNYATGNTTNYNPAAGPPFNPFPATNAGLSFWYNTFS